MGVGLVDNAGGELEKVVDRACRVPRVEFFQTGFKGFGSESGAFGERAFEFGKAPIEVAHRDQRQPAQVAGLGVTFVQGERAVGGRNRLSRTVEMKQAASREAVKVGVIGPNGDGGVHGAQRVLEAGALQRLQGKPPIALHQVETGHALDDRVVRGSQRGVECVDSVDPMAGSKAAQPGIVVGAESKTEPFARKRHGTIMGPAVCWRLAEELNMKLARALVFLSLLCASMGSFAQVGVKPDDVKSADTILAALYDVISGPAGQKRDWDRMRSLFAPGAQLSAIVKRPNAAAATRAIMTVEDYIKNSGPFLEERGFFEKEIARRTETYGGLTHVWSTYEARQKADDAKPFMRGINSIQLMNDGQRWWVVSIFWQQEGPEIPLPEKYLKSGGSPGP